MKGEKLQKHNKRTKTINSRNERKSKDEKEISIRFMLAYVAYDGMW